MRSALLALLVFASPAAAQQPPPLVAPTDALSPAEEKKGFTLPAGFEVQLVASEPQIQKPMQMAFDARGRLWVTTSYHYPFAAPQGKGTDKLFVLSDIDPATGKAGKVQVFADDLNIPIGVLPLPDCKSVIVSSTGEIRKYTDTNDDGKADKMEVLFSGFGFVDTHGMYNSFTLMPDGWVYACHGFRNDSRVKGKDGHEVRMNSGNTFRFRPDGSRIEVYTRGQVNPFGIAVDPWFNLYTADCHSRPITQLIPGAYYESFGKPHDGLGFAEHVTKHDHGSTGLCGLTWYDADQFPKDYLGCMFVGNVVTSRINFDRIEWHGATPVAKELPDFMTSKDLWFRPVDIKLGPDGALYVSDFYNKIIGHYEVDLKHPGRDKDRGRIWRVVWKGEGAKEAKFHREDFTKATVDELLNDLFHPNLTVRFLAGHQFRLRKSEGMKAEGDRTFPKLALKNPERAVSAIGWVASIDETSSLPPSARDYRGYMNVVRELTVKPEQRTGQVIRAMSSRMTWDYDERKVLLGVLKQSDAAHETRSAVEVVIFHPHADFVAPLVELLKKCPPDDTHLRYAVRVALRNCLRDADGWKSADALATDAAADALIAGVAVAVKDEPATKFLAAYIGRRRDDPNLPAAAEHIGRIGTTAERKAVLTLAMSLTDAQAKPEDMARGLGLLHQMLRGMQSGGKQLRAVGGGRFAPGEELEKFEDLATRDLSAKIKNQAVARVLAEVFAALPAATGEMDRPAAFSLTRRPRRSCGRRRSAW